MTAGLHSCHDRCSRPACVMRRERDEARAQVKAWQDEELSRRRERDEARAEVDHMRQGYDRVRADRDYHCDRAIAAVAERDALAAQLAALREAAGPHAASEYASDAETRVLRIVLADAEDAAEAYTRRVRAEALREAAACLREHAEAMASGDRRAGVFTAVGMIGARADEIERGGR